MCHTSRCPNEIQFGPDRGECRGINHQCLEMKEMAKKYKVYATATVKIEAVFKRCDEDLSLEEDMYGAPTSKMSKFLR